MQITNYFLTKVCNITKDVIRRAKINHKKNIAGGHCQIQRFPNLDMIKFIILGATMHHCSLQNV